jgi:cholinesterase
MMSSSFLPFSGGYIEGNATMFTGNDILRESGGSVILVIIQYRLGLFGFLAGQKVKDGGVLNAGLCKFSICGV